MLTGTIDVLDPQFGNLWTNIGIELFDGLGIAPGEVVRVVVRVAGTERFSGEVAFHETFGAVPEGEPLLYLNSIGRLALALNQASFAARYGIEAGAESEVTITRRAAGG